MMEYDLYSFTELDDAEMSETNGGLICVICAAAVIALCIAAKKKK